MVDPDSDPITDSDLVLTRNRLDSSDFGKQLYRTFETATETRYGYNSGSEMHLLDKLLRLYLFFYNLMNYLNRFK